MIKIGILDSGIGGLTTCCAILHKIKDIEIYYYADNLNAPYGTKTYDEVLKFVNTGVERLLSYDVKLIILACNTATAVAINKLRIKYPIKFIGMEPAIKPAIAEGGSTLLLATPLTLKSSEFLLTNKHTQNILSTDSSHLAYSIEHMAPDFYEIDKLAYKLLVPYSNINNVVLGCSHYSYMRKSIEKIFPSIKIFDGNNGVVKQVENYIGKSDKQIMNFKIIFLFSGVDETPKFGQCLKWIFKKN